MNILFLTYWYPSQNNPLKGVFIKKHAQAVASSGCNLHVLSLIIENSGKVFAKETLRFKDEKGIENTQIVIRSKYYKLFHLLLFYQYRCIQKEYRELTKRFKPDLIHSHVLYPAALLGYKLSRQYHLPHVITEHWSKVNKFMRKSLYASMGRKAYAEAKTVTVVSDFLKDALSSYVQPDKITIVPNIINSRVFSFAKKSNDPRKLVYTIVAHWQQPKRPDLIFNSLNAFAKENAHKIVLNVVGEGFLLDELRPKSWGFEVNYLGNQAPDKLAGLLQNSTYFLHASDMETFSIVVAEALATGTPVLASNVGAISELVRKNCGLLCDNTLEAWLSGLKKLTQTNFDHGQIADTTKKYSEEMVGGQFRQIYERLLNA